MKKCSGIVICLVTITFTSFAQTRTISLEEAVSLGLQNSKQLKLAQHKIDEANAQLEQAKDA